MTVKKEKRWFWDIESYNNLFLVGLLSNDERPLLEIHYLVSSDHLADRHQILQAASDAAKEHQWDYKLFDLKTDATRLQNHFKQVVPSTDGDSLLSEFLGVKSEPVKPKEDIYLGYNTLHYDIPMIDHVLSKIVAGRLQTTPDNLRQHSNDIIEGTAIPVNTLSYELYANQVDVAFLDDSFIDRGRLTIGLKTLVGTLGGSIIESESNKTGHSEYIYGDTKYNINDIAELKDVVFEGTKLEGTYNIRRNLLSEYASSLLPNNITVNRTSAKFVENIIAPIEPIVDLKTASFSYPAEHVAKRLGVEPFNVLEYTKNWYLTNVYQSVIKYDPNQANYLLGKFLSIYYFYKSVEGKNWNSSARHFTLNQMDAEPKENRRKLMEKFGTFLPLVDKTGKDSKTYVNFSLGGIHGAEFNTKQLEKDKAIIKQAREKYTYLSMVPSKEMPKTLKNLVAKQSRTIPDHLKDYPYRLLHEIPDLFEQTEEQDTILHEDDFTPFGIATTKGKNAEILLNRYRYISSANTIHQDFAGYYPMCATRLLLKR